MKEETGRKREVSQTSPWRSPALLVIWAGALVSVGLMIFGVINTWHPLPVADEWDGFIGSWIRIQDGDTSALWAQQNEHRILLGRLLFWLDVELFSGSLSFLVLISLLLLASIAALVVNALRHRLLETNGGLVPSPKWAFWSLAGVVILILSGWMQRENLTWGIQVVVFLATALPLTGFCLLGLSAIERSGNATKARLLFLAAAVVLALAPWTMANGLLAPFLGALLAALLGLGRWRVLLLAAVACLSALLYLNDYVEPISPDISQTEGLSPSSAVEIAVFVLEYLGGPAFFVTGGSGFDSTLNYLVAGLAGAVVLFAAAVFAAERARSRALRPAEGALLAFIAFGIATAAITAFGRYDLVGSGGAVPSRYQTAVLAIWACLIALYSPRLVAWIGNRGPATAAVAALAVVIVWMPQQLLALGSEDETHHRKDVAAIALALGAPDDPAINAGIGGPIWPSWVANARRSATRLREEGVTVLGKEPYSDLLGRLGSRSPSQPDVGCQASLSAVTSLEGSKLSRVEGVIESGRDFPDSEPEQVVTASGKVVGFIQTGGPAPTARDGGGSVSGSEAFGGFVLSGYLERPLFIGSGATRCRGPIDPQPVTG